MQVNLLDVTIGAELILFVGYLLYGVMRTYSAREDRLMISFYITVLIGFITSLLLLNSTLSLPRYLPSDIPILIPLLAIDVVLFMGILVDTFRLKKLHNQSKEENDIR
ncbi:MAG: hypothetical protein OEV85_13500 [Candidatus Thorarchaeota archaeon]|nr:hypothetical protein [Candidatus Thorarchaeota archaeon]